MKASNKKIIVTGAGSGMGREIALLLIKKGATVLGIDINEKALNETQSLANDIAKFIPAIVDITERAKVKDFYVTAIQVLGAVDGLVNNAGIIQPFVKFPQLKYEDIERVMNVNFWGTVNMLETFLPHLTTRPEAHIVNISSMGGFLPIPGQTVYGASKAAIKLLTEGLHSEMAGTSVQVTIVFPGAISTNIASNSGIKNMSLDDPSAQSYKMLSASKAAEIIIDGMEKNKFRVLVGSDARFMDIFYRLNPARAASFIAKKMKGLLK